MSRLGDLIRTERLRSKMTPKQVARKCGVSESYLLAVEAGTKIIADDQARRILKPSACVSRPKRTSRWMTSPRRWIWQVHPRGGEGG